MLFFFVLELPICFAIRSSDIIGILNFVSINVNTWGVKSYCLRAYPFTLYERPNSSVVGYPLLVAEIMGLIPRGFDVIAMPKTRSIRRDYVIRWRVRCTETPIEHNAIIIKNSSNKQPCLAHGKNNQQWLQWLIIIIILIC